jgi:hypothetical protein
MPSLLPGAKLAFSALVNVSRRRKTRQGVPILLIGSGLFGGPPLHRAADIDDVIGDHTEADPPLPPDKALVAAPVEAMSRLTTLMRPTQPALKRRAAGQDVGGDRQELRGWHQHDFTVALINRDIDDYSSNPGQHRRRLHALWRAIETNQRKGALLRRMGLLRGAGLCSQGCRGATGGGAGLAPNKARPRSRFDSHGPR